MYHCSMAIRGGSGGTQEFAAAEREDRERALANAEAIVGFAGASGTQEMRALLERWVADDMTIDEVVAEYSRRFE